MATAQAICVVALLAIIAFAGLQVALVIGLRQRAAAAADLAALAASRASVEGADPCRAAEQIAQDNGAQVRECRMDADVATVRVAARAPTWSLGRWVSEQRARAAPSWYLD